VTAPQIFGYDNLLDGITNPAERLTTTLQLRGAGLISTHAAFAMIAKGGPDLPHPPYCECR
jgi:hypothetical protein